MGSVPGTSNLYVNQGGHEAMIGERGTAIPITIDGTRLGSASAKVTLNAPYLYARRTASPYDAVPFMGSGSISTPTNTTNATIDVPDADAVRFRVGDLITFYDVSAGALSTEALTLDIIGAPGSGTVANTTLLTFTGEVWTTPPVAADLAVVSDGTQLSANVVVVLESIEFDGATNGTATGYLTGEFLKSEVNNATYFVQADNQALKLVDMQ